MHISPNPLLDDLAAERITERRRGRRPKRGRNPVRKKVTYERK